MALTAKQIEVLLIVAEKNLDGSFVDLDQILERLSYKTNKPSLQFIVRNLIKDKKLLVKLEAENRRDRKRVLFDLTELGKKNAEWNKPKRKSLKDILVE